MRAQITIGDLTPRQVHSLDRLLLTSYDFPAGQTRMCVIFEVAEGVERHVEMPRAELSNLLSFLEVVAKFEKLAKTELPEIEPEYRAAIEGKAVLMTQTHDTQTGSIQTVGRALRLVDA